MVSEPLVLCCLWNLYRLGIIKGGAGMKINSHRQLPGPWPPGSVVNTFNYLREAPKGMSPFMLQEPILVLEYTHYQKSAPNIEAKLSADAAEILLSV